MLLELLLILEIQICSPRFSCTHKIMRSAALVAATNGSGDMFYWGKTFANHFKLNWATISAKY